MVILTTGIMYAIKKAVVLELIEILGFFIDVCGAIISELAFMLVP